MHRCGLKMCLLQENLFKYLLFGYIFLDTTNIKLFHIEERFASVYYKVRYIEEQIAMIQRLQT